MGLDLSQCALFDIVHPQPDFRKADLSIYFGEYIHVMKPDLKLGLKILQ